MEEAQVHSTIESSSPRNMSSGAARRPATRANRTAVAWTNSRSRSISAGTSFGSDARFGKPGRDPDSASVRPPDVVERYQQ
jgi:hypothetical protein